MQIVTAASCTTNCIAPVIKVRVSALKSALPPPGGHVTTAIHSNISTLTAVALLRALSSTGTPSPRAFIFSLENAVRKDSYRRQHQQHRQSPHCITFQRENQRARAPGHRSSRKLLGSSTARSPPCTASQTPSRWLTRSSAKSQTTSAVPDLVSCLCLCLPAPALPVSCSAWPCPDPPQIAHHPTAHTTYSPGAPPERSAILL